MRIAGGILGIIGGLLGVGAAIVTLFFGGLGAAVGAEGGNSVVGLGWGGLFLSFMALVFAAVAFARPRGAGLGLMISSVLGMLFGGTIVAICMVLSLVGGILAFIDGKRSVVAGGSPKGQRALYWGGAAVVALLAIASLSNNKGKGAGAETDDPLTVLQNATPSELSPSGELAELFQLGGEHTDIQRENKLGEVKGQIVSWCLPVFDVSKSGDDYRVQTQSAMGLLDSSAEKLVGTFVIITARNDSERAFVEALKDGDIIPFRGYIDGTSMRNFDIKPAILQGGGSCTGGVFVPEDVSADPKSATVAAEAIATDTSEETMPEEASIEERRAWLEACPDGTPTAECGPHGVIATTAAQPNDSEKETSVPPDSAATNNENSEASADGMLTPKPSFDCTKASTRSELLICSDASLARLDVILANAYSVARASASDSKSLQRDQNEWRRNVRDVCPDVACMASAYRDRTNRLEGDQQ